MCYCINVHVQYMSIVMKVSYFYMMVEKTYMYMYTVHV